MESNDATPVFKVSYPDVSVTNYYCSWEEAVAAVDSKSILIFPVRVLEDIPTERVCLTLTSRFQICFIFTPKTGEMIQGLKPPRAS